MGNCFAVKYSDKALKALKRIDKYQSKIIVSWIEKNLEGSENPRQYGKPLVGDMKEYWRYRVGAYRIIADIDDSEVIIIIINIGHRQDVYE
jgi:mRNA interferase RelE/StbE